MDPAGPPRTRRAAALAVALVTVVAVVGGVVAVDRLAIGSSGPAAVAGASAALGALALVGTLVALRLAPEASKLWALAAVTAAAVAGSVVGSRAPLDHDRLVAAVAELRLPGGTIAERRSGSPRCDPTCTTLERRVRLVGQPRQAVAASVINQINVGQLQFRRARPGEAPDSVFLATATHPRYVLTYGIGKVEGDDAHVDVVYRVVAR